MASLSVKETTPLLSRLHPQTVGLLPQFLGLPHDGFGAGDEFLRVQAKLYRQGRTLSRYVVRDGLRLP